MEIEEMYAELDCTTLSCKVDKDFVRGVVSYITIYKSLIQPLDEEDLIKISQDLANVFKARKELILDEFYEKLSHSNNENANISLPDEILLYTNTFIKHHSELNSFLSYTFSNLEDTSYLTFCKIYEKMKSFIKDEINVIISDQNSKENLQK